LDNAEYLLHYASEAGIEIPPEVSRPIFRALQSRELAWKGDDAPALHAALTTLSKLVKPVTAETIRACSAKTHYAIRRYWVLALILALLILPISVVSFVVKGISDSVAADIDRADALAVRFVQQMGPQPRPERAPSDPPACLPGRTTAPPPATTGQPAPATPPSAPAVPAAVSGPQPTELQEFAVLIRSVLGRGQQLHWIAELYSEAPDDPLKAAQPGAPAGTPGCSPDEIRRALQLEVPLSAPIATAIEKIRVHQEVRYFALMSKALVDLVLGAVGTVLLPVLYALLGACAYLLRLFAIEVRTRTYAPSYANTARLLTAAIGGMVIALFPNFTLQGPSLTPLAIAFLIGYAVEAFFSFLDNLLSGFTRTPNSVAAPASTRTAAGPAPGSDISTPPGTPSNGGAQPARVPDATQPTAAASTGKPSSRLERSAGSDPERRGGTESAG
jgi:hypothetical protein